VNSCSFHVIRWNYLIKFIVDGKGSNSAVQFVAMTPELEIERYAGPLDGHGVIRLKGPLTMENLSPFQNAVLGEDATSTMILDLTDVPYIDSAGLGSLMRAYVTRSKAGRRFVLAGVNKRVQKLFEITRVEPLFLIFSTLEEAVAALTGAANA
jgi:anti-sigma B factor antagonist